MATHPLTIWSITTSGGVLLFLFLLRRSKDEDDRLVAEGLAVVAAASGAAVTPDAAPMKAPYAAPTGHATICCAPICCTRQRPSLDDPRSFERSRRLTTGHSNATFGFRFR